MSGEYSDDDFEDSATTPRTAAAPATAASRPASAKPAGGQEEAQPKPTTSGKLPTATSVSKPAPQATAESDVSDDTEALMRMPSARAPPAAATAAPSSTSKPVPAASAALASSSIVDDDDDDDDDTYSSDLAHVPTKPPPASAAQRPQTARATSRLQPKHSDDLAASAGPVEEDVDPASSSIVDAPPPAAALRQPSQGGAKKSAAPSRATSQRAPQSEAGSYADDGFEEDDAKSRKSVAASQHHAAKSAAPSRAASRLAKSEAYDQDYEEEEVDDARSVKSTAKSLARGRSQRGGDPTASNLTAEESEVDVVVVKQAAARATSKSRPASARSIRPASARSHHHHAPGGAAPQAGSWLDDSWEGELVPTIVPAQPPPAAAPPGATTALPPRPHAPQPNWATASQASALQRRQSAGGSSVMSRMTSGSVAGVLATAPQPYAQQHPQRPSSARPASAGRNNMADLMRRHPGTWDSRDVAEWVTFIGMEQYRKKFLHNCIDGRLLLGLTDGVLKQELGVGPYGHRMAILEAISALAQQAEDMIPGGSSSPGGSPTRARARPASARPASAVRARPAEVPRRPASATRPGLIPPDGYLGPALGKVTVYEQRSKLLFELDRAAARAAQHRAIAEQLQHTAQLSAEEVAHLRGLLQDLERKNKNIVQETSGGVDAKGRVPWRPPSPHTLNPHPERMGKPGDDPSVDMTFAPRISKRSQALLAESHGSSGSRTTFLDRLEADSRKRERTRKEIDRKYYSQEAIFNDPMLAKRKARKDYAFLTSYFREKLGMSEPLSDKDSEADATIDGALQQLQQSLGIPVEQLAGIQSAHGHKKVSLLAAAIRTRLFMLRYDSEDAERRNGSKLRSLQEKHWEATMGNPKERKRQEDLAQSASYFARLGWVGDDAVTEDRLEALLKRVRAYKLAAEKARDQAAAGQGDGAAAVDWKAHPWSADGLTALQESVSSVDDAAAAALAGGSVTVKGPLAPDGSALAGPGGAGADHLSYTVKLLANCRWDDVERMEGWDGERKQLGVYRHIRTQKFIEFTQQEIEAKEKKLREVFDAMRRPARQITSKQMDGFFERLQDDAAKRRQAMQKFEADKLEREKAILASSAMFKSRPRSAR